VLDESAAWVSATPFLATRYPKLRGRKRDQPGDYATPLVFARHVLLEELERLRQRRPDLPSVVAVDPLLDQCMGPRRLRSIQFKNDRRKTGDDGVRRPSGAFRITFAAPTRGPLCLGHSSHFGLGLFVPEKEKEARVDELTTRFRDKRRRERPGVEIALTLP
jgi:CRISPR-associated protein Csb2